MKKLLTALFVLCVVFTAVFAQGATEQKAFPTKDITLIVPWGAGGSSDLVGRRVTDEMAKIFGVNVSVVNTPGATGTVGMNNCLLKPHDGYTLIANAHRIPTMQWEPPTGHQRIGTSWQHTMSHV